MLEKWDDDPNPRVKVTNFGVSECYPIELSDRILEARQSDPNLESPENAALVQEIVELEWKYDAFWESAEGKATTFFLDIVYEIEQLLYKFSDYESLDRHEWGFGADLNAEDLAIPISVPDRVTVVIRNRDLLSAKIQSLTEKCLELGETPWELDVQAEIFTFQGEWVRTIHSGLLELGTVSSDGQTRNTTDCEGVIRLFKSNVENIWRRSGGALSMAAARLMVAANRLHRLRVGKTQIFNHQHLMASFNSACWSRPRKLEAWAKKLEEAVSTVHRKISNGTYRKRPGCKKGSISLDIGSLPPEFIDD